MDLKKCFAIYKPKNNEWKYLLDKLSEFGYNTENAYALYDNDTIFITKTDYEITFNIIPFDKSRYADYNHFKIHVSSESFLQHAALLKDKEYNVRIPSRQFFKSNFKITLSNNIELFLIKDNIIQLIISDDNKIFYGQDIIIPMHHNWSIFDVNVNKEENNKTLNIEVEYYY